MSARSCAVCGAPISKRNASGLCRADASRALAADPERRAARLVAFRRTLALDPLAKARNRELMARARGHVDPDARRARFISERLWERGTQAQAEPGSTARVRAGRSRTATTLADIPAERRDAYRHLVKVKHLSAAEARGLILEQHAAEMARFTRRLLEASL